MEKKQKEKKLSPAKRRIVDNYEKQKREYAEAGYEEHQETITIVRANVMAFVTAGPFCVLAILLWRLLAHLRPETDYSFHIIGFFVVMLALIGIHEVLHGVGWSIGAKNGWKSIYIGMMWESLTPYCHCKEPLKPRQYLLGVLMPFVVLGAGLYIAAWVSGSYMLFLLSVFNMLAAGGDTTLAWMERKYLKQNESCLILDHPTDAGFIAFIKK